jgi:hypothetical protein
MLKRIKDNCAFKITHVLALYWSLVSSTFLFGVTFFDLPDENVRFADTILGFLLGTIISTIIGYYMGSKHDPNESFNKDVTPEQLQTPERSKLPPEDAEDRS